MQQTRKSGKTIPFTFAPGAVNARASNTPSGQNGKKEDSKTQKPFQPYCFPVGNPPISYPKAPLQYFYQSMPAFDIGETGTMEDFQNKYKEFIQSFQTPSSPDPIYNKMPWSVETGEIDKQIVCPYFLDGLCKFGIDCKYFHPQEDDIVEKVNFSGDMECNICIDKILARDRKFGLLQNCEHAFCLECIRKWRGQYSKKSTKETCRMCPICRLESYYVVPSDKFLKSGPEKEKIMKSYIEGMAKIPCKHFNKGSGECPFGNSCFYSHITKDGKKFTYKIKDKLYKEDGEWELEPDTFLSDSLAKYFS